MSEIRAHVQTDFARHGVAVTIVQRVSPDVVDVLIPGTDTTFDSWQRLNPAERFDGASYRFREDIARALLDALLDHFRGGHDARQLRVDYEAERKRVDKLIDHALASSGCKVGEVKG